MHSICCIFASLLRPKLQDRADTTQPNLNYFLAAKNVLTKNVFIYLGGRARIFMPGPNDVVLWRGRATCLGAVLAAIEDIESERNAVQIAFRSLMKLTDHA